MKNLKNLIAGNKIEKIAMVVIVTVVTVCIAAAIVIAAVQVCAGNFNPQATL